MDLSVGVILKSKARLQVASKARFPAQSTGWHCGLPQRARRLEEGFRTLKPAGVVSYERVQGPNGDMAQNIRPLAAPQATHSAIETSLSGDSA